MNKFYLLAIVAFILVSCSKKSSPAPTGTALSVTGKWYLTADTLKEYQNGVLKSTTVENDPAAYFQFNSDLSGSQFTGATLSKLTYKLGTNNVVLTWPTQVDSKGNPIDMFSETATIRKATTTDLILYFEDTSTGNGITYKTTEVVYLRK